MRNFLFGHFLETHNFEAEKKHAQISGSFLSDFQPKTLPKWNHNQHNFGAASFYSWRDTFKTCDNEV